MIISLLLAFFVWMIHNLSSDYFSYFQYKVAAHSNLTGYGQTSVSNGILVVRGKASGYYLLRHGGQKKHISMLEVTLEPKVFHKTETEGTFSVTISDIREILSEALEEHVAVDFFETDFITFTFEKQSFKKVPVEAEMNLSFKPQYMQVGATVMNPDSVTIYGNEKILESISSIKTKQVSIQSLSGKTEGYVEIEKIDGIRIDETGVFYTVNVERYVEKHSIIPVSAVNIPAGKTLMLIPSKVEVAYTVPFKAGVQQDEPEVIVDYRDYVKSSSSKIIPTIKPGGVEFYSCSISPKIIECILTDN